MTQLPSSIQFIVQELNHRLRLKPAEMVQLVKKAHVKKEDLMPWADFNHPPEDSYGRKLIYKGEHFEIMVMSWVPGDFSTIHDHGYTQWGAVQIFGPAEHATFRLEDDELYTLARWMVNPGDVVGVSHNLIHQMGNATQDTPFLSFHVYGCTEPIDNVTGAARLFDLENETIQRVDGGVFYALPEDEILKTEAGPKGDYPTTLRYRVELTRRLANMQQHEMLASPDILAQSKQRLHDPNQVDDLLNHLQTICDQDGHHTNSVQWRILYHELKATAQLQNELKGKERNVGDSFDRYATIYDEIVCKPCYQNFMKDYVAHFIQQYEVPIQEKTLISLGCGTGLVEAQMMQDYHIPPDNLYGIDFSEAMINEAKKRIHAEVGDILTLDPAIRKWDLAYSGLNVFHYLPAGRLEEAIQKTAAIINAGGYFFGDFITPDHIRWYPNVLSSPDQKVVSLRTPTLIEREGLMYQESEILNLSFMGEQMEVNYAGKHHRFLPPMNRVRYYFEKAFGGRVDLYDVVSKQIISPLADSCPSTRYFLVARKA